MFDEEWAPTIALLRRVLTAHGGVVTKAALLAAGLSALQVAALLGEGYLERPRKGWYVDPELPWQAKCAVRVGGVLTCASAADAYGIPVPPEAAGRVDVRLAPNTPRLRHSRDRRYYMRPGQEARVVVHWVECVDRLDGWRTSLIDTLLHLGSCLPVEWFVVALDAALHRPRAGEPLLTAPEFVRLVQHLPRRLRRALRLVDPRAESGIETLLRLGLVRRGIGPFDLQVWTHPEHRVDIVVRGRLILEADGKAFHDPEKDAIRDALMRRLEYTVLRFDYERIVFDLENVLDEIEAALARLDAASVV